MDAIKAVVKNPVPFYATIDQYQLANRHGSSHSREQVSPLHICVAQRLCRVLKSTKRKASEKRSLLLFFMACLIRGIYLISDPLEYINVTLCILSSEEGSGGDICYSHKRKSYFEGPNSESWGIDGADIDMFNMFWKILANLSVLSSPSKKRAIGSPIMNLGSMESTDQFLVAMHPIMSYFSQEVSREINILHEIGIMKRIVLYQHELCTFDKVSNALKTLKSLAEGHAQMLEVVVEQLLGFASEPFWRSIFVNLCTPSFEMALVILKSILDILSVNFEKLVSYPLALPQMPVLKLCKLTNGTQEYFRDEEKLNATLRACDVLYESLGVEHKNIVQMYLGEYLECVMSSPEYRMHHVLNLCKKVLSESLPGATGIAHKLVEIWNSQIDSEEELSGDLGWRFNFLIAQIYSDMNFQRICQGLPIHIADKLLHKLFEMPDITACSYISSIIRNGYGREKSMILLQQSMEKAKLESNLCKRRVSLFKMCTIAYTLLRTSDSDYTSDVQSLKIALFGPLLSFFMSTKKINPEDGPGKQLGLSIGHYGLLLLEEFLKADDDEIIYTSIVEKLIVQIDQENSGSLVKPVDHLAPSVVDKLHCACLLVKKASVAETDEDVRLKWEIIACRTSIIAIHLISAASKMKGEAPLHAQEALNKLLSHELGDCIANLSNSSREGQVFQEMMRLVHNEWLQVLIALENDNPMFWTSLRRFEASLLPEEDSNFISKDASVLVNLYNSISHAVLKLITSDFVLDLLRNSENSPPPLSRNAAQVSLPLTSVLSYHASVPVDYHSSLGKVIDNASQVKLQICELIETYNDFMALIEDNMKEMGQEHLLTDSHDSVLNGIQALIPYLLASYGASLSSTDVATWSLLKSLNKRVCSVDDKRLSNSNQMEHSLWALFHGPLSLHR